VREKKTLERIRALAIPPAYREVWISPDPRGHLQATGRDAKGRKQYRYHAAWREVRNQTKFDRMLALSRVLPAIRARVSKDLAKPGLPREKVLAALVRLLESTLIRIGNEQYVRDNRSYGLTTLRDDHVGIVGGDIVFEFRGKRGKKHACKIHDRPLARILARCQAIPGEELFQYVSADGVRHRVDSDDVNAYLREAAGEEFSAKDLRTWAGSLLAARTLSCSKRLRSGTSSGNPLNAAIDEVAEHLHNTRAVCRKYYIHPAVIDAFESGQLTRNPRARRLSQRTRSLAGEERALVSLIRRHMRASDRVRGSPRPSRRRRSPRRRRS
jgi:DNA topoisomerase-1